jgi:hypothetical protein
MAEYEAAPDRLKPDGKEVIRAINIYPTGEVSKRRIASFADFRYQKQYSVIPEL